MRTFSVSKKEFQNFRDVQIRPHAHWPAVFSCNLHGDVWPFSTYGFTHDADRVYLSGKFKLLGQIVKEVLIERPEGGRFFVNDAGVFIGSDSTSGTPILKFEIQ